jgi:hypothetical protein
MARTIRFSIVLLTCGIIAMGITLFYWTNRSDILIADRMSEFIDTVDHHHAKNERKLIAFDLDDTVFMSSQLLGSPTWFYNMINVMRKSGAAKYEAYSVVSKIDKIVQGEIRVVAVEQATLSAIRAWQNLGVTVVGLTSRPKDLMDITKAQLKQIGLEFKSPFFSCVENAWSDNDGAFRDGVLFVGDILRKGEIFGLFYHQIKDCGLNIDLIAQADDQQRYVTEVARFAKDNRVDFIGIIYGGALSSRNFDLSEAKKQLLDLETSLGTLIVPMEYRRIFASEH